MGITIVQKSDLSKKKSHAKIALVLAGGAITGGTYKVGGLKALDDFLVNRKVTDFDMYVGVSAGGLLAVPLAGGIGPDEILKSLDGSSKLFSQLSPWEVYYPNFREFFERPLGYLYHKMTYFPGILYDSLLAFPKLWKPLRSGFEKFLADPDYSHFESMLRPLAKIAYSGRSMPSLSEAFPSGLFDTRSLERFMRKNLVRNDLPNDFRAFQKINGKSLYICAMNIDSSERVVFGADEKNDVSISEAVQASLSLPPFYKPARIKGIDYIDGAVRKTLNADVAIAKGAQLVICYNPFRPYSNKLVMEYLREEDEYVTRSRRLSSSGIFMILNQVFRTVLHTRVRYFTDQIRSDPKFKGDLILIEPKEDDPVFFEMNPFSFWSRAQAAQHGFNSVRQTIRARYDEVEKILSSYGITMTQELVDLDYETMKKATSDDVTIMSVLEQKGFRGQSRNAISRLRLVAHS
ncbi:MAG: patatin-like phospholipase family protein [Deltaproteobacteria bacterium]|nr:patatin-like phospholipase family protein [Deltaproteobacteria bacterium]MBI2501223.1 patatin-like phospholipase family protein [Deltaproteobacteria bacterium]